MCRHPQSKLKLPCNEDDSLCHSVISAQRSQRNMCGSTVSTKQRTERVAMLTQNEQRQQERLELELCKGAPEF